MNEPIYHKLLSRVRHNDEKRGCSGFRICPSSRTRLHAQLIEIFRGWCYLVLNCLIEGTRKISACQSSMSRPGQGRSFRSRICKTTVVSFVAYHLSKSLVVFQNAAQICRLVLSYLILITAIVSVSGCGWLTKRSTVEPSPLVIASCPQNLTQLSDDTMGAAVNKIVEVSGIYYTCITAIGIKK